MITVKDAYHIVLDHAKPCTTVEVPLMDALGMVLAETIVADRDFPPYDRVTMDGIAIRYDQFANGQNQFEVESIAAAGSPKLALQNNYHAIEVMTGAILPEGVDTVIRYEDIKIDSKQASLQVDTIKFGQNIHSKGSDRNHGSVLLQSGTIINPSAIAIAATVGKSTLSVKKLNAIGILTTGDELVEVDQQPEAHQIRTSNSYTIQAALKKLNIESQRYHVHDTQSDLELKLQEIFDLHDIVIISGGVSKGKFDFVPAALAAVGVEKKFHRVKQRPGKPFWFGASDTGKTVFALPGNPVSSYMCTIRYVLPYLRQSLGLIPDNTRQVILGEDITFNPALLYMLPVKLENTPGGFDMAQPFIGNGSGDFANLIHTDGFLELEAVERSVFKKGEVHSFWTS
jgi:molybdopterin molybdotransferase